MQLHRILALQDIVPDAAVPGIDAALALVAERAARGDAALAARIVRRLQFSALRNPIAIGRGVALPHASVVGIPRPRAVFLRLRAPLALATPDDRPIRFVFALLVPSPAFQTEYDVLMHCTALLNRPGTADELARLASAPALHEFLVGSGIAA